MVQDDSSKISKLKELVPTHRGRFHTPLHLEEAWLRYDKKYCVSSRRNVPPSFNEVRHTMNLAQVVALEDIQLACFDGDGTLYTDQANFSYMPLAESLIVLMQHGVTVVLVTAAGYGFDGPKYEARLQVLLDEFVAQGLGAETLHRFMVLGGKCNYLLRCDANTRLQQVPDEEWSANGSTPRQWPTDECERLLDVAEASLRGSIADLKLRARLIRKPRGIGIIPGGPDSVLGMPVGHGQFKLKSEALDEVVHRARDALNTAVPPLTLPFCAFNGGGDAWVDVGNKSIGIKALQAFLKVPSSKCVHVGDQFLKTGNDVAAREISPCLWIQSPKETRKVLEILLGVMDLAKPTSEGDIPIIETQPDGPGSPARGLSGKSNSGRVSTLPIPELAVPASDDCANRSASSPTTVRVSLSRQAPPTPQTRPGG